MRCSASQSRGAWSRTIVVGSSALAGIERLIPRRGCGQREIRLHEQAARSRCLSTGKRRCRESRTRSHGPSHVWLAGWQFGPSFALRRDGLPAILRNLLAQLSERVDVRVLAWAGAPFPVFRPSRRAVRPMRDELCRGTKIQCALDSRERPLHCHHEKTIVIDDRVAFVGGIDLTAENGDRFDSSDHMHGQLSAGTTSARGSKGQRSPTCRLISACVGAR